MRLILLLICGGLGLASAIADVKVVPPAAAPDSAAAPEPQGNLPTTTMEDPVVAPALSTNEPIQTAATLPEKMALDPKVKITKIHAVENNASNKSSDNTALDFEKKYWNHGAILQSEKDAREGQIYVVSWKNSGTPDNLKARFEYRQVKTKDRVNSQVVDFPGASGTKRAIFQVVGQDFAKNGPVYSWRLSILRGDQVVAMERSFIW
jgi:hypothetical protein